MCESREGQHEEAGGGIKDPCTSWHLESFPLFNHLLQRLKRRVSVCVCVCVRVIVHRGRRGFHPILDGNYTWQVWWMFSLSCTLSSLPAGFMKRHQPTFGIGTRELEKKTTRWQFRSGPGQLNRIPPFSLVSRTSNGVQNQHDRMWLI